MTVRKFPRPSPRPITPAARILESSVTGWYARWKASKDAPTPVEPAPPAEKPDERADAVARWLMEPVTTS